jgi:predicted nucleotidyltransferase
MNVTNDVDLLVEFDPGAKVDLVDHAGLMVSKRALKPLIRESILGQARSIYSV